jgi:hypothetical protein
MGRIDDVRVVAAIRGWVTNPGGAITQRRALPAEFNAIQWLAPEPLAPGARMNFTYDVTVE